MAEAGSGPPTPRASSFKSLEAPRLKTSDLPEIEDERPSFHDALDPLVYEDLSDSEFTSSDRYEFVEASLEDPVLLRPLISPLESISALREEYEGGTAAFVHQIDWLSDKGYIGIRRTRGDGDCFYRSLAFAYVENIMNADEPVMAVTSAISALEASQPLLEQAGFQRLAFEDFYDTFIALINWVITPDSSNGTLLTPRGLLEAFNTSEVSNSIVVYLRLLTSAQIRTDPESYDAFLFDPELGEPMGPREFCESFVEAMGKEADHVQMTALSRALRANISVAYLDGRVHPAPNSSSGSGASTIAKVDFVELHNNDTSSIAPIILLYRPGHYDALDRRAEVVEEEQQLLTFENTGRNANATGSGPMSFASTAASSGGATGR